MPSVRHPIDYAGFVDLPLDIVAGRRVEGLAVARQRYRGSADLDMAERLPADGFHIPIILGAHVSEIAVDGRIVHSGRQRVGEFSVFRPGERIEVSTRGRWDCVSVFLSGRLLRDVAERAELAGSDRLEIVPRRSVADPCLHRLAWMMAAEVADPDAFTAMRMDVLVQQAAVRLVEEHSSLKGVAAGRRVEPQSALGVRDVERIRYGLEALPVTGLRLAAVAEACGRDGGEVLSVSVDPTGSSPMAWLIRRRIERAKALLLRGPASLAEIASALGFGSTAQLTTAFRRSTGAVPEAWRRIHRP